MTLTKEQIAELCEAAKPLMKWLSANCHPHCKAEVTPVSVEVLEALTYQPNRTEPRLPGSAATTTTKI